MIRRLLVVAHLSFSFFSAWGQTEIKLEDYFRELKTVKVEIGGRTYDFLFDTGGGITFISPSIAKDIGKNTYGLQAGYRMSGERFESPLCDSVHISIGGHSFYHQQVGVYDLMRLLPEAFRQIDGLISLKTFEGERISLILKENRILLETEESFRQKTKQMSRLKSRFANGLSGLELNVFAGVFRAGHYWWFLFDTGNISKTKISESTAGAWGIVPEPEGEYREGYEIDMPFAGDSVRTSVVVDKLIHDGALCFDLISSSVYIISFPEQELWKSK